MQRTPAALILALAAQASATALAGGLHVCNESGERVQVALVRYEGGTWVSQGYWRLQNTKCATLTASLTNSRYYVHAFGDSGRIFAGKHKFCTNAFASYLLRDAQNLNQGCNVKSFFSVWVPDMITGQYPERYTVVLGSNTVGLDHPRAER